MRKSTHKIGLGLLEDAQESSSFPVSVASVTHLVLVGEDFSGVGFEYRAPRQPDKCFAIEIYL